MTIFDRLRRLFSDSTSDSDSSSQTQREALLDLLVWTMYVDHHLALTEREKIEQDAESMPWTGAVSLGDFLDSAIVRARDVLAGKRTGDEYLNDISERLGDQKTRQQGFRACEELVSVDGRLTAEEARHLKTIQKVLLA